MRTDSTTLSDEAIRAARAQAASMFGDDYVADAPRRYDRKVKNAQEAHEAIRPAGETLSHPRRGAGVNSDGDERARLRPGLEAHDRLPDGRRPTHPGPGASLGRRSTASRVTTATVDARVERDGAAHRVRGLSPGLRRGHRRPRGGAGRPGADPAAARRSRAATCRSRAPRPRATTPSRPTATPRRRSSRSSRTSASGVPRRTPRS